MGLKCSRIGYKSSENPKPSSVNSVAVSVTIIVFPNGVSISFSTSLITP